MAEQSIEERLAALLDRQDDEAERALQLLYGALPPWFPAPRLEHAKRIVCRLRNDGFTPEQIARFVDDEISDNEKLEAGKAIRRIVPGVVRNAGEFIRAVNELAHIKYALTLPINECLGMLAGELAASGAKSHQGYKNRDEFQDKPDCQAIAKTMWEENPSLTIAALMGAAKIAPYAKKYKGKHTLRDWLSEIDPRPPEKKRGRKKKIG